MKQAIGRVSCVLALAALASCGEGVGSDSGFIASLRIINLSPDAPDLETFIDGAQPSEGVSVAFGESSDYHGFGVGEHTIDIRRSSDTSAAVLDLGAVDFEGQAYTLVAIDNSDSLQSILFPDTHAPMADTDIRLRAIHAGVGAGQIDFLSVAPDGTVAELSKNLDFGDFSESMDLPAGTYTIGIDIDNDMRPDAYFQPADFPAATRVNIYYTQDTAGDYLVYAQLSGTTTERIVPARSSLRVFHASADAPNIDVNRDGAQALSNLAFAASSDGLDVQSGTINLEFVSAGTTDALVAASDLQLLPNRAYTAIFYGEQNPATSATALRVDMIADDSLGIDGANLRYQVFHAAAGIEEGDVYSLNAQGGPVTNLVPDLAFGGVGSTPDLPKAKYSVGFEANSSGLIIAEFEIPALTIESANVIIIQDSADAVYLVAQLAGSATALICEAAVVGDCLLP